MARHIHVGPKEIYVCFVFLDILLVLTHLLLINQEVIHTLTKHIQNTFSTGTVKQGYSEHAYDELTLTAK